MEGFEERVKESYGAHVGARVNGNPSLCTFLRIQGKIYE